MTYLLQPYDDFMKNLPADIKEELQKEYLEKLASVDYNLTLLLDLATHECEDYFIGESFYFYSWYLRFVLLKHKTPF